VYDQIVYDTRRLDNSVISNKYRVFFDFLQFLQKIFPKGIKKIFVEKNEIEISIKKQTVLEFFYFIKSHSWTQFKVLSDIIVIDFPGRKKRFDVIYQLLSIRYNTRVNILVKTSELASINSITDIYSGAAWYEREVWDLYGIFFENHPDLRRILTDYSFEGHPLRKDFPLTGYFEVFYDDTKKRIVYEPVSLVQEYRYFTFLNPWVT
jgi:NADH/F420H2 dehydrogenase subunit C